MKFRHSSRLLPHALIVGALALTASPAFGQGCNDLPDHTTLSGELDTIVTAGGNGGLGNDMWATMVDRDGIVCQVAFSGLDRGDQWPGSRVISAQKANTANAFSLPVGAGPDGGGLALSTANLWTAVQPGGSTYVGNPPNNVAPGGSLFGLQHSNPVNTDAAYGPDASQYGEPNDPMVGQFIGGVNVFGGGLALYDDENELLGGIGLSGDTSCTDHIIAWKLRNALGLDHVPAGVSPTGDDNIIHDLVLSPSRANGHAVSPGGFGHPECDPTATGIAEALPQTHPVGF